MDEAKQALIELENKVRELEVRIKKLENWKLVHTSISEEKRIRKHYYDIARQGMMIPLPLADL